MKIILTAALFLSTGIASAQVANSSFEDNFVPRGGEVLISELDAAVTASGVQTFAPIQSIGYSSPTASPWTFGTDAGLMGGATTDGGFAAWLNPQAGKGSDATVSQTLNLISGGYTLSFDSFAQEWGFERFSEFSVSITNNNSGVSVLNQTYSENAYDTSATSRNESFNARNTGSYTLQFTGNPMPANLAASAGDTFIDNVRINAVPEPSSALFGMIGLVALSARRKR